MVYKEVKDKNSQRKGYVGCNEGTFKKRGYNFNLSFRIENHINCTKLASHVRELKGRNENKRSNVRWSKLRRAKRHRNDSDVCRLCQEENLAIVKYPNQAI